MLLRWIENARKKPKTVRNQYAFFGAVILTSCIGLIWVATLPGRFANLDLAETETEETTGAFAQFLSNAKQNMAATIKAQTEKNKGYTAEPAATTTEPVSLEAIALPALDRDTIENVRDEYEESLIPAPRVVLIATSSPEHKSATSTSD